MTTASGWVVPPTPLRGLDHLGAQAPCVALYTQMLQRVIDRGLSAELDAHLGYEQHDKASEGRRPNARNGTTAKRLKGTFGTLEVNTPRDRAGTFEPQLVKKRQTRLGPRCRPNPRA